MTMQFGLDDEKKNEPCLSIENLFASSGRTALEMDTTPAFA